MPPKIRGGSGSSQVPIGHGDPPGGGQNSGGPPPSGGATGQGRGRSTSRGGQPAVAESSELIAVNDVNTPGPTGIQTVGVRRPNIGRSGRRIMVYTNHFSTTIPNSVIHHYNVDIGSQEQKLPARLNIDLIRSLQNTVAPQIFTPKAVYDSRKNLFAVRRLPFPGERDTHTFHVALDNPLRPPTAGVPPKMHKVTLTHVAEIDPKVLSRFLEGKQSHDNMVQTAIMALNVVVRMDPVSRYPFNTKSFFTSGETRNIGRGIVLWRGYFQSVRPAPKKLLINIDVSTAAMHKEGPLIALCLEKLDLPPNDVRALATREKGGTSDTSTLSRLSREVVGIRIQTLDKADRPTGTPRVIKRLTRQGASELEFELREGGKRTVAQYFQQTQGQPLKFPHLICAEVGTGALIPLEKCYVPSGQLMRKQLPPDMTKEVVEFAQKRPNERLASICAGLNVLQYGQSEYVRSFGMVVEEAAGPLRISARVLPRPSLVYGTDSKTATITPSDGTWNMRDQKFYRPAIIEQWMVVIYERPQRYNMEAADNLIRGFEQACDQVGIRVVNREPEVFYNNGQLDVIADLKTCGGIVKQKSGRLPTLVVAVLPEASADIYTAIKHFGDIQTGVATQCVKANKTFRANSQYWANVLLKVNVKLGGINMIPAPQSMAIITDPVNPTIFMGAKVIHPAPGSTDKPSFTALVSNVDSDAAKYVSSMRVQLSRRESIDDLEEMAKEVMNSYIGYRKVVEKVVNTTPERIIFYRGGISNGQFPQVLKFELPLLKAACRALNISPKITIITTTKRHHVRIFPEEGQGDRSGNCPAGTVVDTGVVNPAEFDFYLQSHAGLLGTSCPSHYHVLYDENGFSADKLQSLTFSLCHLYARSTRSVAFPAPIYYADIVCSRAKNHFEPSLMRRLHWTDSGDAGSESSISATDLLAEYKSLFKPVHMNAAKNMYFT